MKSFDASYFISIIQEVPAWSQGHGGTSCMILPLLLLGGCFAFALAAQVDAARVNQHAQRFEFFLGGWFELFGAAGIELPAGVVHYVVNADAGEDSVEFEQACL